MVKVAVCFILAFVYVASFQHSNDGHETCDDSWNYKRGSSRAPYCWHKIHPEYCGQRVQSPINIETAKVQYDIQYNTTYQFSDDGVKGYLENTGKTAVYNIYSEYQTRFLLVNVPWRQGMQYKMVQFHMHFAAEDNSGNDGKRKGSEHVINCKGYDGEFHFVHKPLHSSDGHVVVAVFVKKGEETDSSLQSYFETLKKIDECGTTHDIDDIVKPFEFLMPSLGNFYTYEGSLTTPHCNLGVSWIVKKDPITVSESDFVKLSKLNDNKKGKAPEPIRKYGNVRPPFPMHSKGRILANFKQISTDIKKEQEVNDCTEWFDKRDSLCKNNA